MLQVSAPPLAKHMLESLVGASESERRRGGGQEGLDQSRAQRTESSGSKSKRVKGPSTAVLKAKHHNVDGEI